VFQFSDYFYEKKKDLSYLRLKAVILTGEMVFPHQVAIIKTVFGCDVTEEYGCTEVGVMAFRCRHGNMHLMENLLIEESADMSDCSGNMLVSELYGSLFPFIRYQIGDRGHIDYNRECPCGRKLPVFEGISGRQDEFIRCSGGKMVDPYIMEYLLDEMPSDCGEVSRFRIIQKSQDHIDVFFVAKGNLERIREYVGKEFSAKLSRNMKTEIHFVHLLERTAAGKCRCFISEI
jgi:phenylacetate-CoA ligase